VNIWQEKPRISGHLREKAGIVGYQMVKLSIILKLKCL